MINFLGLGLGLVERLEEEIGGELDELAAESLMLIFYTHSPFCRPSHCVHTQKALQLIALLTSLHLIQREECFLTQNALHSQCMSMLTKRRAQSMLRECSDTYKISITKVNLN